VTPHPDQTERLLAETGWVHQLARSLVAGQDRAEDVAQETLLRALSRPLGPVENLRAWLAAVARSIVFRRHRDERRRERALSRLPERDPEPSAADVLARTAMQRDVMDAALGLPEPYRTVVLLRFQGELGYAEIAQQLGVPLETVRTRIKRGLQQLRERLDAQHGSTRAWALPLLGGSWVVGGGTAASVASGVIMGAFAKVAAVLVVGLIAWWSLPASAVVDAPSTPFAVAADARVAPVLANSEMPADFVGVVPLEQSAPAPSRELVSEAGAVDAPLKSEEPWEVVGRVLDGVTEAPIGGASITLASSPVQFTPAVGSTTLPEVSGVVDEAQTDAQGVFHFGIKPRDFDELIVAQTGFAAARVVLKPWRDAAAANDPDSKRVDVGVVRLYRAAMITGRCVTDDGVSPVPNAVLTLLRCTGTLQRYVPLGMAGRDGYFAFAAPFAFDRDTVAVLASSDTSDGWSLLSPGSATRDLTIRLCARARLECGVEDDVGRPVANAFVSVSASFWPFGPGPRIAAGEPTLRLSRGGRADERGAVVLEAIGLLEPSGRTSVRTLRVIAEGRRCHESEIVLAPGDNTARVVLVRGASATVRGTVVSANNGQPIEGAMVKVAGSSPLRTDAAGQFLVPAVDVQRDPLSVAASADGYVPTLVMPGGAQGSDEIAVLITLQPGTPVCGVVLDADGKPVAGVRIESSADALLFAASDAEGHFHLPAVPPGLVKLRVVPPFQGVLYEEPATLDVRESDRESVRVLLRRTR
jgi:RNA polymerase sigma-70 factor (ECF subfamily)